MMFVLALRRTYTKVEKFQWTARDRAQEAVHRAFDRFHRLRPPEVTDFESAKAYLAMALRSELSNVRARDRYRQERENAAAVEEVTLGRGAAPSAEQMNLDRAEAIDQRSRAERMVAKAREELRRAGDPLAKRALATMDLIAKGTWDVHEQASILRCSVEQIFYARKRRKRAMKNADEAVRAEDEAAEKERN